MIHHRSITSSRLFWLVGEFPPNPGGIATFAATVGPLLARLDHDMHLLVGWNGPAREQLDGLDIIREPIRDAFERGAASEIMHFRRRVIALKHEIQPTLYHVHASDPTPVLHLTTASAAPAPTVLTMHNEMVKLFAVDDPDSLFTRLLHDSRIITGVSSSVTRQAALAVPELAHRIVTIPNGVPIFANPPSLPDRPQLLAIGRLMHQKGFDRLVRAMPTVLIRHPDAQLDVIGEGPERPALEALITEFGLTDSITLHGFVDRDLVPGLLADAQVVIAPSRYEGLPYALLEASMAARPIVASRTGGIDEVVIDDETGTLIDQKALDDDPTVLGHAICALLDDRALAHRYGMAGRERTIRVFSVNACAAAYDHVYRAATAAVVDIAVIIPAWNAGRHLTAALDSVIANAASIDATVQILVIDDGSTDDTSEVASRYADQGVELFWQPNLNTAMARNAGIALTNSRYVAHLDADDTWPAGRLAALMAPLELDPDLDAVFGRAIEFADADAPSTARWSPEPMLVRAPTVGLLRRSTHDRFGGFAPALALDQVNWTGQALARNLRYGTVDDIVLSRRIHAANKSHSQPFTTDRRLVSVVRNALAARRRQADEAARARPSDPAQ